ncbi:SpoIIE family protein phosphatase [Streptomyces hoynatensis]|uniref:protein-serine/threonine phosphatase n=1 Tax=Streptomyces hoynatensis TaxID=1141874 RepID=A0A3A9YYT1_9ACTN|nr:SpoIIE family protein phosphatase [Streptomyces hoynatensis]RKN40366.1 PAS domain S-box protein [Streptomyces hoynatensis]
MGPLDPSEATTRRFPPRPESVSSARWFVRAAALGAAPELADAAELLTSELVTNAVLHARTEVTVSVSAPDGAVYVRVTDRQPARALVPQDCPAYAGTGQGLALVGRLASGFGTDVVEGGKEVWFRLRSGAGPTPPSGWETVPPRFPSARHVTLLDVPGPLYKAAQQHRHALLREVILASLAGEPLGLRPEELTTAHDVNNVISAQVSTALREQPADAEGRSLSVALPSDAGSTVPVLRRVLDLAEEAAADERLLTLPSLPRNRLFHEWLFDEIIRQLAGRNPTAWTVVPREPSVHSAEMVPWETGDVRASRVPTVAADETNTIIAANASAADLLGWQVDDLVGRRLTTLIPEHLRQRHRAAFASLLLTGRPRILGRSVPLPALHRDGRLVPVRLMIQLQETTDGRTVFVAQLVPRATTAAEPPRGTGAAWHATLPESGLAARPATPPGPEAEPPPEARPEGVTGDMPAVERLSLLADIGGALSNTMALDEGVRQVGRILTRRLADWCMVDLFTEETRVERVSVVGGDSRPPPDSVREGPLPPLSEVARGPLARVLRGAGPLLLGPPPPPEEAVSPLDAHYREVLRALDAGSVIAAPLRARREILGALTVARVAGRRPFAEEDVALVGDLVSSIALGVDNARLYQETRNIAEGLQHSLLPELPEIPHLRMAARYASSSTTAQVGGDWYDSFVVPGGDVAVVIGDVTGHNFDAAIAMSQLRGTLRGIAVDRQAPPDVVLRRLDMANRSLYREATATCIYGLVKGREKGPWVLEHSSAGHLPPLLTTAEGDTRYLDQGAGLLLGMDPDASRPRASAPIPAHATVLLYTDGLIERRGESLEEALTRLRRHTAAMAREPLDVFCDELLIRLGADSVDDIAVLALRPTLLT